MAKKTEDKSENKGPAGARPDPQALLQGLQKNMSKEQMQQLVAAMQKQQMAQMPKHKRYFMQFMQKVGPTMQAGVTHIDDFIKFVTRPSDEGRNDVIQSARGPILFGTWVAILFFGFGMMWAAIAPLDSASSAMGTVKSSTEKKVIQHRDGGILKEILVKQGDFVKEGEPLFILDDTSLRTQYESALTTFRTLKAEEGRLKSERDNLPYIEFSSKLLKDAEKYEVAKILETQKQVFKSRRSFLENSEKLTMQKIRQNEKQIEGLKEKKVALAKNREVLEDRLKSNQELFKQGIISKTQLADLERQSAEAKGNDLQIDAQILQYEQETSVLETQLSKEKSDFFSRALEQLKEVQKNLSEAKQRYVQAKEVLDRTIIRSPVDGTVNKIDLTTIGATVPQANPIAEISPEKDFLIVEARIKPQEIAYITPGMTATIRFGAFKSRTTPTFSGIVTSLSPDVVIDKNIPQGDNMFYIARIEINMEEFEKEAKRLNLKLLPGMQADVMIRRGTRTLLRYLLDPITDNMFKAFKEK